MAIESGGTYWRWLWLLRVPGGDAQNRPQAGRPSGPDARGATGTVGLTLWPPMSRRLRIQPVGEGRSAQPRVRPWQQRTCFLEVLRIVRVAHALDAQGLAAAGGDEPGGLDYALLSRPGHLGHLAVIGGPLAGRGQLGNRLGDGAGRDQLGAHLRHIADIALTAPRHQHRDELVELGGAQHPDG